MLLLVLMSLTAIVNAQSVQPRPDEQVNPSANISWPPPIYVLRGQVDIRGTANIPNMNNYFVEFRPLQFDPPLQENPGAPVETEEAPADSEETQESPWFPVTLPNSNPVTGGILGTWNTETTEDGLYELRLTINVSGAPSAFFIVSPIRVENNPPDFVQVAPVGQPTQAVAPTQPSGRPTLALSPTPLSQNPVVTANLNANVRAGDDTRYERIDALLENQTADVIAISSTGSGWYYVRLPDGNEGWIAPTVVTPSGDFSNVPRRDPPPPPATPTPVPPTQPPATGDLGASAPALTPVQPTCNVPFQVLVNVTNTGTTATSGPATVLIQDIRVADGSVQASFTRTVPVLQPGDNFVVGNDSLVISTFFGEEHRIVVTLDSGNNVIESNETNNVVSTTYTLQPGSC